MSRPRLWGSDAALAVVVVSIVALMVVPLPTWMLDLLLATNLAVSIAILLVTLYVGNALEISAFPTLLLLTTLVRVALNVSSTRLILLHGSAGHVIQAFGTFVVGGNFVVGAIIFVILTIVQFVVVAKGSERVAEVGARFTLDAMPGKQLAIDAEVRAGAISAEDARVRRRELERESHFYGAMDGAVKFVKGDVIATLLIAIVNLVGGVAIGMTERGLDATTALRRYGLLTIGDGLVTQIPALLLATSAGILVTRVASEEAATTLGAELSAQLLGVPRALGLAGVFVLALALVPGLPAAPFVGVGAALLFLFRRGQEPFFSLNIASTTPAAPRAFIPLVVPWSVEACPTLRAHFGGDRELLALTERLRGRVFLERGVPLPPCRTMFSATPAGGQVVLAIHEVPSRVFVVPADPPYVVPSALEDSLGELLVDRAADFLGVAETKALLDELERHSPATVRQLVPKTVEVAALTEVLRRLVEEHVSIRDLKSILEALSRLHGGDRDALTLAEHVRGELRRPLTWTLINGASELEVILLDSGVEDAIRQSISKTSAGSFLAIAPGAARDIVSAVRRAIDGSEAPSDNAIVLTRPDIRRFVRKLLETDFPKVRVISFAELLPETALKTKARVSLSGI